VRVRRQARLQKSARIIQRAMRRFVAMQHERRRKAAVVIQVFWRGVLFMRRCQARIRKALRAQHRTQMKRLAASLLVAAVEKAFVRDAVHHLRLAALVGRWEDHRAESYKVGLAPEYDERGRFRVQIVFPEFGPEILGALLRHLPPFSANTLHKHLRSEEFYFVLEGTGRIRIGDVSPRILCS
jgi:mannose-6-phosphate isomerase-like protein (cupin superfamily)